MESAHLVLVSIPESAGLLVAGVGLAVAAVSIRKVLNRGVSK